MEQTQKVRININHVNPKVAEAYSFLGQALGVTFNIQPAEAPKVEEAEPKTAE